MAQVSTAISDLLLSIISFYSAGMIVRRYIHAAVGLLLIAMAAGVGTIRFLNIVTRQQAVTTLHDKLSWLGAILGIPLIAVSFALKYGTKYGLEAHSISAIVGIVLSIWLPYLKDSCTRFVSTLAMFSIFMQCFQMNNVAAITATVLYAVASVMVGTSGYLMGYRRVDIFHYILVVANITFAQALLKY